MRPAPRRRSAPLSRPTARPVSRRRVRCGIFPCSHQRNRVEYQADCAWCQSRLRRPVVLSPASFPRASLIRHCPPLVHTPNPSVAPSVPEQRVRRAAAALPAPRSRARQRYAHAWGHVLIGESLTDFCFSRAVWKIFVSHIVCPAVSALLPRQTNVTVFFVSMLMSRVQPIIYCTLTRFETLSSFFISIPHDLC
jgi:hypothetical protein